MPELTSPRPFLTRINVDILYAGRSNCQWRLQNRAAFPQELAAFVSTYPTTNYKADLQPIHVFLKPGSLLPRSRRPGPGNMSDTEGTRITKRSHACRLSHG